MKTNHMEKGKIGVTTENIFPIIKKFLYSDHEIFLRELVSNATDAIQKLKTLSSAGEFKGELGELQVKIAVDPKKKTITVSDNGIGMSAEEIDKYLNQIAFSSANEFLDRYKDQTSVLIGHFGLGFYSSFMVSDKVQVISKSYLDDVPAVKWTCDGSPEYSLEETTRSERGTDVILHIDKDSKEFLEESRIETLLKKYCRFLPVTVAFGNEKASDKDVIRAAKAAQAHEFITQTSDGYKTKVGERGVTLSGGQKQRIAIARALLMDPRILILDDATASVDTETEHLIQLALAELVKGRTTFLIAHRLSTVRNADLILVLDSGAISTQGTHEELLATSGVYRSIYNQQLKKQEGDQ